MLLNTAVDRYIKEIKKSLVFSDRETKAFLKRLRGEIAGFVEENNTESLAEIENQLGSASSVAAAFYENTDIKDVKKRVRIARLIKAAAVLLLIIFSICLIAETISSRQSDASYAVYYDVVEVDEIVNDGVGLD